MEQLFKQVEQKILSLKQELGVPIYLKNDTKLGIYEDMILDATRMSEYAKTIFKQMNIYS